MLYNVASSFVKIDETQGIIQNASSGNSIEVSDTGVADSGIILKPGESLSFTDTSIYVRTIGNKSSAVRVVPFVQGFTAGSTSDSASENFSVDHTSILINSTSPEGKAHQEMISFVNPKKTKAELSAFGQMVNDTTINTYESTYRVDKALCDGQEDEQQQEDYSKYLVVDSPFTEDFTDNCGKTWELSGNPQIQDGKLYFDGSSSIYLPDFTLGGKDFTIQFTLEMLNATAASGRAFYFNAFELCRESTSNQAAKIISTTAFPTKAVSQRVVWINSTYLTTVGLTQTFTFSYWHNTETLGIFANKIPIMSFYTQTKNSTANLYLSHPNNPMVGYISNLKIWDGVALYPNLTV